MTKLRSKTLASELPRLLLGLFIVLSIALLVQACGSDDPPELVNRPCPVDGADSEEDTQQDLNQLACDNSNFAFDLYRTLSGEKVKEENLFFSPFSISQVLAMAFAGARGETERQMSETLRFGLAQDRLHPAFSGLDAVLRSRGEDSYTSPDPDDESTAFRLNIANAIWGQEGYKFHDDYLNALKNNYQGELRRLDFHSVPEESRVAINDWVDQETEGKIKSLFPQGSIDSLTRLVLTNAIYFNGGWYNPFFEEATEEQPFYLLDGNEIKVPMMTARHREGLTICS